ncbi:MAG: hypothetical protein EB034_06970 [Verrucomicrobia bacterium]|nr:hypothetical protein [Verrucomicrobiota bacterium]
MPVRLLKICQLVNRWLMSWLHSRLRIIHHRSCEKKSMQQLKKNLILLAWKLPLPELGLLEKLFCLNRFNLQKNWNRKLLGFKLFN